MKKNKAKKTNDKLEKNDNKVFFDPIDKKEDKKQKRKEKSLDKTKTFRYGIKKWAVGTGKEFTRISWPSRSKIFKDFLVVIIVCIFLALVFLGIDMIILSI